MTTGNPIERFVEELSVEETTDFVLIVAQQDPTEMIGKGSRPRARWNAEQRELISAASNAVADAGLEIPDSTD